MATPMTSSEYSVFFKLLDDYCRAKHHCFVAELTFIDARDEYDICFRPTGVTRDSPNRYACRYLAFGISTLIEASQRKELPVSMTEQLDKELPGLGQLH